MLSQEQVRFFEKALSNNSELENSFNEFCECYYPMLVRVREISDKLPISTELPQPLENYKF